MKISKNESLLKAKKRYESWAKGFYIVDEKTGAKTKDKHFHPYTEVGFKFDSQNK